MSEKIGIKITGQDPDVNHGTKSKGPRPVATVKRPHMTVEEYLSSETMDQSKRSYRWCAANAHRIKNKDGRVGVRFAIELADGLVTVSKAAVEIETRGGSRYTRHEGILSGDVLQHALAYLDPVIGDVKIASGGEEPIELDEEDFED